MGDKNTSRFIPLVSATLTIVGSFVAYQLTSSLTDKQSWGIVLAWMAAGIAVTYLLSRLQERASERSPEAIKERVGELEAALREQVRIRSYGARRDLIEDPLEELGLDVEPRVGWVRDPRLVKPASEKPAGIVAAFESSERRLLIVGEPGAGKIMAAYSLVEYLDETEGDERTPLLVNLSAREAQETFEAFLVDYLCSSVGYQVNQRAVALAFVRSLRYSLILDGLDEIPFRLRTHLSERLDGFMRGLPREVAVVVTCRTREYDELLDEYRKDRTGLGLVQAVEILPLTDQQLDRAFIELAKRDENWKMFLSQQRLRAYRRVRDLLSTPLFLNLAVVGRLGPDQLLDWSTTRQELRGLVIESYLDSALADQRHHDPQAARGCLSWIARFLNGAEVSPFGLKTTDPTVFDLADLTPPEPPRRYRLLEGLALGLAFGLALGTDRDGLVVGLILGLAFGLVAGLVLALVLALPTGWPVKRSAVSSRLTLASWPSTRRQLLGILRRASRGLGFGLALGLALGLGFTLALGLAFGLVAGLTQAGPDFANMGAGLVLGLVLALGLALVLGLGFGLLETRSVLITSRTPEEARSRSLIAALTWLVSGLVGGLPIVLLFTETAQLSVGLSLGLGFGLVAGLDLALRNGGWFVLLQKVAHRRLARAGNLPSRPYDFLEWGVENQIFRRIGSGVRFRHDFIQQHLANTSEGAS